MSFPCLQARALSFLGTNFICLIIYASFSFCFHTLKFASQIFLDTLLCPMGFLKTVPVSSATLGHLKYQTRTLSRAVTL